MAAAAERARHGVYRSANPLRAATSSYGLTTADFDGDGVPDVISAVYSPTNADSYADLLEGSGGGVFSQNVTSAPSYPNPRGVMATVGAQKRS